MTRLYLAIGDAVAVVTGRGDAWDAQLRLAGLPVRCVATDPIRPEVVYCGTFGEGLRRSADGGETWARAGDGIRHAEVTAVAVSAAERAGRHGIVWAGTEPSALFRSEDGGETWQERPTLRDIPSSGTWSFPPRPWTHHVRWIEPDPRQPGRLFVAIELGGVMRSEDGGLTWDDRKPGAKLDAHTLRAHGLVPGRVYEAAGDGYAETGNGGDVWRPAEDGLAWRYLWGLAVDPADPGTVVVSASPGPRHAHDARWEAASTAEWHEQGTGPRAADRGSAPAPTARPARRAPGFSGAPPWVGYDWRGPEAWIYRRQDAGPWQAVGEGLPEPRGTLAYVLTAQAAEPHAFYASPRSDAIYRSVDAGRGWQAMAVAGLAGDRPRRTHAMVAVPWD